jgi:DNA-directed RNA polymerase specialized sigma24 family protein
MGATTQPGIEDLYREHPLGLVRFALLTGDRATAEDVVQDAFLGVHRHWDEVKDPGRVLAYLRTAVVNGNRSRYRRHLVARRLRPLAAPMARIIALMTLAALGLSGGPVHEPVHAGRVLHEAVFLIIRRSCVRAPPAH